MSEAVATKEPSSKETKPRMSGQSVFKRLFAAVIFLSCVYGIFILSKDPPITVFANGVHVVDIAEPGNYVVFFKGNVVDPFGWDIKSGRYRASLRVHLEPLDPNMHATRVFPFRDLSGVNFYSVAEFKVMTPGRYLLSGYWERDTLRGVGTLTLEKNPVEKFVYQWSCGITGAIAFLIMIGIKLPKGGY
ncbi:MAG: hypothetical protein KIT34_06860 [Cyanobacteria bacterium TGS_CYA1]|nr:hypothetical protein [Cyanobacteria bacterium TGS_CYA1]